MSTYRLLFFRNGQLDHWEEFEADDHLAAIAVVGDRPSEGPVELWTDSKKVATFKPAGAQRAQKLERTRSNPAAKKG